MKRIYLCGPMTGIKDFNYPAFNAEAARLRALGYEVVNPAEVVTDKSTPWVMAMRADIAELMTCDTLAMLTGCHNSKGARIEHDLAYRVGIEIKRACEITEAASN